MVIGTLVITAGLFPIIAWLGCDSPLIYLALPGALVLSVRCLALARLAHQQALEK